MLRRARPAILVAVAAMILVLRPASAEEAQRFAALVFSKTAAFRHDSIPSGIEALRALGKENGFPVDASEDAAVFSDARLARYRVVVFLMTTGDILDAKEKAAFQRFIARGGGFVGIHSASDTEYDWPWYGRLLGAWFESHPSVQDANVIVEDRTHPATLMLPATWRRRDEWYNFRSNPRGEARVLATVSEASYAGGKMGADHPIAWCQNFDGGRSWYTAMGHTSESYLEPLFRLHLLGGIESAAGVVSADCTAPPG